MKFISIDIECNQPSGRITQIAAISFDTQNDNVSFFNKFIDLGEPFNQDYILNNKISLGELMGDKWQREWKKEKQPRAQVLKDFWTWLTLAQGSKKIIQWGGGDIQSIRSESKLLGLTIKRTDDYDLKKMYRLLFQPSLKLNKGSGLEKACISLLPLGFIGRPHDAYTDAYNTGRLAKKMFNIIENYKVIKDLKL